jgi:hypothetical protein
MSRRTDFTLRPAWALLALIAAATTAPAFGADKSAAAEARARYLSERAVCTSGQSQQDRATCLQEAAAAYAEARKGTLDSGTADTIRANQLKRCEALPDPERKDCLARMQGSGTTSGSAATGGIYRELVTRTVGPAVSASAAAASAASAPAAK